MAATRAGIPNFSRRKSTSRSMRLAPPPLWRIVMRPYELRPPVRFLGDTSRFSGSVLVISSYRTYVRYRRAGEVGLTVRIGMLGALHELDLVARGERHDGLLPAWSPPLVPAHPLELSVVVHRADVGHFHVEHRLDRRPDLDLVRVRAHLERDGVLFFLLAHVLLGHERTDQDVARRTTHWLSASSSATRPRRSNTTRRARMSW